MKARHSISIATGKQPLAEAHVQQGDASRAGMFVKVARLAVQGLLGSFFHVRVEGRTNIARSQAIICCNHLGWVDPFLILCYLPVEPRIYVLGYSLDYVEDPGARAFRERVVDSLKVMVPLHPNKPAEALRISLDLLGRGGSLLIFPEGTSLGGEEGKLLELQPGAAHMSQLSQVPLLPVGITGTRELWLRKTLTLRIGKPITPAGFQGSPHERTAAMTGQLEKELRTLIRPDRQRPRVKLLRNWLTMLFYGEEHFTDASRHHPT